MASSKPVSDAVKAKRVFLIDGMSHIFRSFYAIRGLTNSQGLPTNAAYGFASMLRKLIREYQPEYIAVVFDGRQPTFRHEAYESYKANRTAMPEDLAVQFPYIRKLCDALQLPILEMERYEADDIIGTFARKAEQEGLEAVIVSNDKDMFQLVTDKVKVLHQAKEDTLFDPPKVKEFFGVAPTQVIDVLGLMGDSVDNIPGAPGIGEKGARDLINRFGSVENLLAKASEVDRKAYRESLQNHNEEILRSKQLVTIDTQVPLKLEWQQLQTQPPNLEKLRELFVELGFQSMLKEFEAEVPKAETQVSFVRVTSSQQAAQVIQQLRHQERVFCYFDLDNQEPMLAKVRSLALAGGDAGWVVPFDESSEVRLTDFLHLWEDAKIPKVVHNAKLVQVVLLKHGVILTGIEWDTMLMSYLVHPTRSNHQFEEMVFALLEKTPPAEPEQRCVLTRDLFAALLPKLRGLGLEKVYREIELPLSEVLARMEWQGIRIDARLLAGSLR